MNKLNVKIIFFFIFFKYKIDNMEKKNIIKIYDIQNLFNLNKIPDTYNSFLNEIEKNYNKNSHSYHLACLDIIFEINNEDLFNKWKKNSHIYGNQFILK